jgi:GTP pyrophosphokinase
MGYSPRFVDALLYANRLHADQLRKNTSIPYITHLMAVAALVGENGGDEEQVIAALLHDAVEDQGGHARAAEVREQFGPRVAAQVEACTDAYGEPKPPWRARKEAYIAHVKDAPLDALLISAADKLHNARCLLTDMRTAGVAAFEKFRGGREGTLWYNRSMVQALTQRMGDAPLVAELNRVDTEIERLNEG